MSFYSSNQQRLKKYTADRRVEQSNGDKQQAKVYADIAAKQGDLETADRFAKLGMNIIGKIAQTNVPITNKQGGVARGTVLDHVKAMIEAGTLSQWWEAVKKIPKRKLSSRAYIVQKDMKFNEMLKSVLNEQLAQIQAAERKQVSDNDIKPMIKQLIETLAGDIVTAQELDDAASDSSSDYGSVDSNAITATTTEAGHNAQAGDNEQNLEGVRSAPYNKFSAEEWKTRLDKEIKEYKDANDAKKKSLAPTLKSSITSALGAEKEDGVKPFTSFTDLIDTVLKLYEDNGWNIHHKKIVNNYRELTELKKSIEPKTIPVVPSINDLYEEFAK